MLDEERGGDHADAIVHVAGRPKLAHPRVDHGIAGLSLLARPGAPSRRAAREKRRSAGSSCASRGRAARAAAHRKIRASRSLQRYLSAAWRGTRAAIAPRPLSPRRCAGAKSRRIADAATGARWSRHRADRARRGNLRARRRGTLSAAPARPLRPGAKLSASPPDQSGFVGCRPRSAIFDARRPVLRPARGLQAFRGGVGRLERAHLATAPPVRREHLETARRPRS